MLKCMIPVFTSLYVGQLVDGCWCENGISKLPCTLKLAFLDKSYDFLVRGEHESHNMHYITNETKCILLVWFAKLWFCVLLKQMESICEIWYLAVYFYFRCLVFYLCSSLFTFPCTSLLVYLKITQSCFYPEQALGIEGRICTCRHLQFLKRWPDQTSIYLFLTWWIKFRKTSSMWLVPQARATRKHRLWGSYVLFSRASMGF